MQRHFVAGASQIDLFQFLEFAGDLFSNLFFYEFPMLFPDLQNLFSLLFPTYFELNAESCSVAGSVVLKSPGQLSFGTLFCFFRGQTRQA